mgnify:CR=1 FL=1
MSAVARQQYDLDLLGLKVEITIAKQRAQERLNRAVSDVMELNEAATIIDKRLSLRARVIRCISTSDSSASALIIARTLKVSEKAVNRTLYNIMQEKVKTIARVKGSQPPTWISIVG